LFRDLKLGAFQGLIHKLPFRVSCDVRPGALHTGVTFESFVAARELGAKRGKVQGRIENAGAVHDVRAPTNSDEKCPENFPKQKISIRDAADTFAIQSVERRWCATGHGDARVRAARGTAYRGGVESCGVSIPGGAALVRRVWANSVGIEDRSRGKVGADVSGWVPAGGGQDGPTRRMAISNWTNLKRIVGATQLAADWYHG
tara:strand:- start:66 stop:671 length:606 start_codon:yes stop_codon:yes gene_type:complete